MLSPSPLPGLFITGTDTGVGKTVIAGAIAQWFARQGRRVAVCKPIATGCVQRREGLVSEDAEFLAHCADARHPLDLICPQRYVEPLAPAVAAQRSKLPVDYDAIDRSIALMARSSDVLIVEGVGGILVPLDERHTVIDLAQALALPVVIVARPGLGTLNHTFLTLSALRERKVRIAGLVINRYPTDTPQIDLAIETNPRALEKFGKAPVLCIAPEEKLPADPRENPIPPGIAAAVGAVDWQALADGVR